MRRLCLLFLAACGLLLETGPATAADFQFWYGNTGRISDAIQALCDGFNRAQNRDHILCRGQGGLDTAMQKAIAAYRAGKPPALLQVYDFGTLDMLMSGAVEPVGAFMARHGYPIVDAMLLPAIADAYETVGGQLAALPFNASTLVLYVNRDRLRQAGIAEVPETWAAFEAAMLALQAAGEACPFAYDLDSWKSLDQVSAVSGAPVASLANGRDGLGAVYLFSDTVHRRFMSDLLRWAERGLARYDPDLNPVEFTTRAFASGRCAMTLDSTGSWTLIREAAAGKFDVGIGPLPRYDDIPRHNTLVGGAALWVMKGFDEPVEDGIAAFLAFVLQPENQIRFARATGYLPVTLEAERELDASGELATPAFRSVTVGLASLAMPETKETRGLRLGFLKPFRAIWREEIERVIGGETRLGLALAAAQSRGDDLLRRFERMYGGEALP